MRRYQPDHYQPNYQPDTVAHASDHEVTHEVAEHPEPVATPTVSARRAPVIHRQKVRRQLRVPTTDAVPPPPPRQPLPSEVLDRVYFRENDAELRAGRETLNAVAGLIADNDAVTLILFAHADAAEDDPERISVRRAETVKAYLITRGVPDRRILVRPMGAGAPLRGQMAGGYGGAENRCVQLAVVKQ